MLNLIKIHLVYNVTSINFEKLSKFEIKLKVTLSKKELTSSNNKGKKSKNLKNNDYKTAIVSNLQKIVCNEFLVKNNMAPTGFAKLRFNIVGNKCDVEYTTDVNLLTPINSIEGVNLNISNHEINITQNMIDSYLYSLKRESAKYVVLEEDRKVIPSDLAYVKIEISDDFNYDFSIALDQPFEIINLPKAIIGMRVGETKTINDRLPSNLKYKQYSGKNAQIKVTVNRVLVGDMPTIDDEFSKDAGFDDVVILLSNTISYLRLKQDRSVNDKLKEEICGQLSSKFPVEISDKAIQDYKEMLEEKLKTDLDKYKWSQDEIDNYIKNSSTTLTDQSRKELMEDSILSQLALYFRKSHNFDYDFAKLMPFDDLQKEIKYQLIKLIVESQNS